MRYLLLGILLPTAAVIVFHMYMRLEREYFITGCMVRGYSHHECGRLHDYYDEMNK